MEKKEETKEDKNTKKEENENSQSNEASSEDKTNEDIDYKSKLEQERKRRKQAEYNIEKTKKEKKQIEDKMEQTGLNREEVETMLDDKLSSIRTEVRKDRLESELDKVSSSSDERAYIKEIYKNRIRQTGNIKEDLENAKVLANKDKYVSQISELKRSKKSDSLKSKGNAPGQKTGQSTKPNISDDEKDFLRRRGATYDPNKEGWVFPKTGRVWKPNQ